jgi:hypothetical protein
VHQQQSADEVREVEQRDDRGEQAEDERRAAEDARG